jgi:hypothetical protein
LTLEQPSSRAVIEICSTCGKLAFVDDLVTIPAVEYMALKKAASAGRARKSLSTYRAVSQSTIARKPDIADFIVESAATMTVKEVREACLRKFGDETPSRSSIFRFIKDMKNAGMVPGRFR